MFSAIYLFELRRWFKSPMFYIYCGVMFLLSWFLMISAAGFFESITTSINSVTIMNSPIAINSLLSELNIFIYFFLPSLVGGAIQWDFKHEVHSVIYSYPFKKWEYLLAKFLSGMTAALIIVLVTAIAIMIGTVTPGTNPDLLGAFRFDAYLYSFGVFVIPNLFFYGAIVFGIVTFTRSVSVGFISVLAIFMLQIGISMLTQDVDNKVIAAMLDPFGSQALSYYTEYWTIYEQNFNALPLGDYILYNRLIWGGIGLIIFMGVYASFKFHQEPISINFFKKSKGERFTKRNFGSILTVTLPEVHFNFSLLQNLKLAWQLSNTDLKYIVTGWAFIIISIVGVLIALLTISVGSEIYGTDTLPVTWQMLELPGTFLGLFTNLLTFLYAGMLLHRSRNSNIDQLVHTTPIPNWSLLLSKFLALIKMQAILLSIIMFVGIGVQLYKGYFDIQIGLYLFELYGVQFIHVIIWALLALFVHTWFKNYYLGFFILLVVSIGLNFIGELGIEQRVFQFNQAPPTPYSDMNGYGHYLAAYYVYKLYWLALGVALYALSIAFFRRGLPDKFSQRWSDAKKAFSPALSLLFTISFVGFVALGSYIWYVDNVKYEYISSKESEKRQAEWEINYGKFKNTPQPRIVSAKVDLDLYPETRDFEARGTYILKNKTDVAIDSIHVDHGSGESEFAFAVPYELVLEDDSMNYDIYLLETPLQPGDSLEFTFKISNKPNELLRSNSPILHNGTFINNQLFPRIGYNDDGELSGKDSREKFGLSPKERMAEQTDSAALMNNYISYDADWMDFETTISTSLEQIAIAPGYLQKEWTENGRRYFHYKMDSPILNFYSFISAEFEVAKDSWNDVAIEVYYHKDHKYNVDRMIKGVKRGLDYYTEQFSPYQHRQVRIIEFPRTSGGFAQSFANTIPYSEAIGFIAAVDDEDEDGVDYPFSITAHEVAHQWWAHQVIGANVQGATVMSESMSEYSSLKVLEKEYGESQMRTFLKDALDRYLTGRAMEGNKEKPLIYNENQQYIHYNKGSLVLYALSDYIGEDVMNAALSRYIDAVGFQNPPYTTATEFTSYLEEATPDSLQYLIDDMFRTITLYDNRVKDTSYKLLPDSTYEVSMTLQTIKYRTDEQGKRIYKNAEGYSLSIEVEGRSRPIQSYPLNDWIEVGIFGSDDEGEETVLYLEKLKFTDIETPMTFIVDQLPVTVGIDPYNKLIDTMSDDNRRATQEERETEEE